MLNIYILIVILILSCRVAYVYEKLSVQVNDQSLICVTPEILNRHCIQISKSSMRITDNLVKFSSVLWRDTASSNRGFRDTKTPLGSPPMNTTILSVIRHCSFVSSMMLCWNSVQVSICSCWNCNSTTSLIGAQALNHASDTAVHRTSELLAGHMSWLMNYNLT